MKTIIILLVILGFSISGFTQNSWDQFQFKTQNFGELKKLNRNEMFPISPYLNVEADTMGLQYPFKLPEYNKRWKNEFALNRIQVHQFKMPVLKQNFPSNMPVFVPDPTVNYAIKEKKMEWVNPLEMKK